ncbi:diacylglycerol kinase family protein [Limibacter armeniacum]|uniref:diacylglycerol/lipid kinase family protein n=1 Tax=Limibacter armeniacum TaxID=466084 RepID=UPI002FE5E45C
MERPKILFIVNPISGASKGKEIASYIKTHLDGTVLDADIRFTEAVNHATEIAIEGVKEGFKIIAAVGGDGTINETAKALRHTDTALGIIPIGSGNGLARHLGIPLQSKFALKRLVTGETRVIDSGILNDVPFFCTAGTGFDAYVSHVFATATGRGLSNYVKAGVKEYLRYSSSEYELIVDGDKLTVDAYAITVANAAQYGNNAYIAPEASTRDGLLNVTILKHFPKWKGIPLVIRTFNKTIHRSPHVLTVKGKKIQIRKTGQEDTNLFVHRDGEPYMAKSPLNFEVVPQSLKVIV